MNRYDWTRLTPLQVGRYAEYFVKMEFALLAFEVFTPEVDDRGIDFVVRNQAGRFYEVQVKSVHRSSYIFMEKSKCPLSSNRLIAVVLLETGAEPELFVIPIAEWSTPGALLVSRDFIGKKSKPEWGIQLSRRNRPLLEAYRFGEIATGIAMENTC